MSRLHAHLHIKYAIYGLSCVQVYGMLYGRKKEDKHSHMHEERSGRGKQYNYGIDKKRTRKDEKKACYNK